MQAFRSGVVYRLHYHRRMKAELRVSVTFLKIFNWVTLRIYVMRLNGKYRFIQMQLERVDLVFEKCSCSW